MASLIILVAMFALLWVLLIRPQRQRQQQQQSLLSSIETGDEILTVGGLYGIVREIDEEDDLIVEVAEGIQVRIARRAVGGVVKPEADDEADEADEEESDEPDDDATADAELADGAVDGDAETVGVEPGEDPDEPERR